MPYTAQQQCDDFRQRVRRECDQTTALRLMNEIDEEIIAAIPLRRAFVDVAIAEGVREFDISEDILRIWACKLYTTADPNEATALDLTDCDTLDLEDSSWRTEEDGTPREAYEFADEDSGQWGINPASAHSTKLVSGATNATPIVVTTTEDHGFIDGDQVLITGVVGNLAANGTFYVNSLTATTFSLFSDSDLATAVAGTGLYTAGGVIAGPNSPKLVLECSKRTVLLLATSMPATPAIKNLYRVGMDALWMSDRRLEGADKRRAEFDRLLASQSHMKMTRQARKQVHVQSFKFRSKSGIVGMSGRIRF
jgi:hypothetical protein